MHELPGVLIFAIRDRTVYWRTYEGVHEYDLDNGSDRLIVRRAEVSPGDAIYSHEVYSAENGLLAFTPNDDHTILAGRSVQEAIELFDFREYESPIQISEELKAVGAEIIKGHTDPARLSPNGAWLSFGLVEAIAVPVGDPADGGAEISDQRITPIVVNTATGERMRLAIPDAMLGMPSVWLGETTVQVVAFTLDMQQPEAPTSVTLYTCSVPDATCQVGAKIQPPMPSVIAFPDGRWHGRG